MASDILTTELVPSTTTKKTSSTSGVKNDESKSGTSLFDNMLKDTQSKQTKDDKITKSKQNNTKLSDVKTIKSDTKTKGSFPLFDKLVENISTKQTKDDKTAKPKQNDTVKSSSLLDKLAIQNKTTSTKSKDSKDSMFDNLTKKDNISKDSKNNIEKKIKDDITTTKSMFDNLTVKEDTKVTTISKIKDTKKVDIKKDNKSKIVDDTKEPKSKLTKDDTTTTKSMFDNLTKKEDTKVTVLKIKDDKLDLKTINSKDNKSKIVDDTKDKDIKIGDDVSTTQNRLLMDSLVANIQSTTEDKDKTNSTKSTKKIDTTDKSDKQIQAKIFLSNQQTQKEIISKQKITEVKQTIEKEPKTTKTIKKATEILELNASEVKIETKDEDKSTKKIDSKSDIKEQIKQQNTMLNKLFLNNTQDAKTATLKKEMEATTIKISTQSKDAQMEATKVNDDIKITVDQSVAQTFNTKIIESKQKMNSFMSDVARQMYLNYKPPVTSFTIKLDPINLGNIAITMRNNKADNKVSVSMNMSQNNTLEAFTDNKSMLQNALNRVFNDSKSFTLDFGMQQDNNQFSDQSNQQQQKQQQQSTKQTVTQQTNNTTEDIKEEDKSYM